MCVCVYVHTHVGRGEEGRKSLREGGKEAEGGVGWGGAAGRGRGGGDGEGGGGRVGRRTGRVSSPEGFSVIWASCIRMILLSCTILLSEGLYKIDPLVSKTDDGRVVRSPLSPPFSSRSQLEARGHQREPQFSSFLSLPVNARVCSVITVQVAINTNDISLSPSDSKRSQASALCFKTVFRAHLGPEALSALRSYACRTRCLGPGFRVLSSITRRIVQLAAEFLSEG